ncbi:hypothetical protein EJD97_007921 [Solanum chilense]|uniref:Putative plant transposon protein domain-containing protein n=1 Tax=Solanum chilense TaxID=4083 RepID=A0A6N2CD30_SOLCI|nr:hypothetical protein EJD97_007921 [Solanum chilense]
MEPKGAITKATWTLTTKFLWLIVHQCQSPTAADNIVTWDRAVLMAAMIAEFDVDFAWLLEAVMHERAFKVTTTYTFLCMIFSLCRSAGVPIWPLISSRLRRELMISASSWMRPMSWLHAEGPVQSITTPSSSLLAPFPALVPLARVQKLEAQMATLLHYIHPCMKRYIAEVEEHLERKMAQDTEQTTEEIVLAVLFPTSEILPPPSREHAKRRRGREENEARSRNKEHREMKAARRASIADEEAHLIRAVESAAGASSSRDVETAGGTVDSVVGDEDTTEGV